MATYDGVLKDYPGSAWAHYERFQTRMAMATKEGKPIEQALADWPKMRDAILACDPLYEMLAQAQGQEDIFRLTRRLEINIVVQGSRQDGRGPGALRRHRAGPRRVRIRRDALLEHR